MLLLVLGALTLVLILTVVYAAVGKGDRGTARAVESQQDLRESVESIGRYAASIIGGDPFDAVPDLTEEAFIGDDLSLLRFRTENADLPVTDFTFFSVPGLNDELANELGGQNAPGLGLFRFNPTGGHSTSLGWPADTGGLFSANDPRIPNDPWLSATRPFDLGEGSKDPAMIGGETPYLLNPYYARAIDWPQISNIAPDGRFVNKFFLRNNQDALDTAGSTVGFDIPSLDLTRDPNSPDEARLTMFDEAGEILIGTDDTLDLGFVGLLDRATGAPIPFGETEADWNRPAHWTMYQRNMFRSVAELNRLTSTSDVNEPTFWEYSYADADGDGMIDSRWFELVDAGSGIEVELFPDDRFRFFAAARIIDLSSLINVNTATDFIAPPTLETRAGEGPHEVSLFSLLTMGWHGPSMVLGRDEFNIAYGSAGEAGIDGVFDLPTDAGGADDYELVGQGDPGDITQGLLGVKAYKRVKQSIANWEPLPYEIVPSRAEQDGIEELNRDFRSDDMSLFTLSLSASERGELYRVFGSTPLDVTGGRNGRVGPFNIDDQIELLTNYGLNDPTVFTPLEQAFVSWDTDQSPAPAGDRERLSRSLLRSDRSLFAEAGDRTDLVTGASGTQIEYDERELNRLARSAIDVRSLLTTVSGARPLRSGLFGSVGVTGLNRKLRLDTLVLAPTIEYRFSSELGTDGENTDAQAAAAALEQALLDNAFFVYLETLAPYLGEGQPWDNNLGAINSDPDPALLGGDADVRRTLFYGHDGPELALRLAAQSALNFRDMADAPVIDQASAAGGRDGFPSSSVLAAADNLETAAQADLFALRTDEPTRALLWQTGDEGRRTDAAAASTVVDAFVNPLPGETPLIMDADDFRPEGATETLLDPFPAGGGVAASQDALVLHGVEAQPFISEAVFMNAFWDAPRGTSNLDFMGPDREPVGNELNLETAPLGVDDFDTPEAIAEYRINTATGEPPGAWWAGGIANIDWRPLGDNSNGDFLFQLVAFQLVNPFDVPVALDDLYIEFGDMFYRFEDIPNLAGSPGQPVGNPLVLAPRETVLAYATNPGLNLDDFNDIHEELEESFANAIAESEDSARVFTFTDNVLDTQFGDPAGADAVRRLPLQRYRHDPGGAPLIVEVDPDDVDGDLLDGDPSLPRNASPANRYVMLWRDLGLKFGVPTGLPWAKTFRRDDVLLDRLVDRDFGADPILDQRLYLDAQEIPGESNAAGTTVGFETFFVENALNGYTTDGIVSELPGLTGQAGDINLEAIDPAVSADQRAELSVLLWGKLRRHDDVFDSESFAASLELLTTADPDLGARNYPSIQAGGDPGAAIVRGTPVGGLPAAAIEIHTPVVAGPFAGGGERASIRQSSETEADTPDSMAAFDGLHVLDSFEIGDVGTDQVETAATLRAFLDRLEGPPAPTEIAGRFLTTRFAVLGDLRQQLPEASGRQPMPPNFVGISGTTPPSLGEAYSGDRVITYATNGLEFRRPGDRSTSQLRVGDMLLPLAIGPYRRPLAIPTGVTIGDSSYPDDAANAFDATNRINVYNQQWVTLGEILGVVTGYSDRVSDSVVSNVDASSPPVSIPDPFNRLRVIDASLGAIGSGGSFDIRRVLDRGRLRLDAYVPFMDTSPTAVGLPDPNGEFDPGVDRVRGYGIPLAATIFEIAQAGGELGGDAYGAVDRPIAGLVNINTAPPSVLRTLPGLFPNSFVDAAGTTFGPGGDEQSWFWDRRIQELAATTGGTAQPHLNAFEPDPLGSLQTDVASSLLAYREASNGHVRMLAGAPPVANQPAALPYDMSPTGLRPDDPAMPTAFDARQGVGLGRGASGIEALRTAPGFRSLGELLAVRDVDDMEPTQHAMDGLGRDGRTLGVSYLDTEGSPLNNGDFMEPVALPTVPDELVNAGGRRVIEIATVDADLVGDPLLFSENATDELFTLLGGDQVVDDYDEQLAQINMLLNSASVSSDYYAAWLLIHGYTEDDTLDLGPNDPLVPSFRGRYLLIVDRSSVTEPGDEPTVMAFLELPIDVPTEADPDAGN
ncbi:MAG: hypothetical protein AAGF47_09920 [Planctomycetota bacterium]